MVQCNLDIQHNIVNHESDAELNKHGFHLNPMTGNMQDRESDNGSMISKYKIDLMFTIDKKDTKGIKKNTRDPDEIQIENKVQEKIDEMFKEIALNDMMQKFQVDYLGSIQLNSEVVHSLETLQEPLKKLYISYKKEKQMKITNKKSVLEITKSGLKLSYGNKLEQVNSFSTICVWASVKLITRPHGINKEFGLEYCFVPLIADYNNNIKFIKLSQNESYLFPKNTYHDNIPIFVVVMKKMCTTKILESHAFICGSNDEAINIAANLYKTLLLTSNKHKSKIKQKNGITSCMSVNDSLKGSVSKLSQIVRNGNMSNQGSVMEVDKVHDQENRPKGMNKVESVVNAIENRVNANKSNGFVMNTRVESRADDRKLLESRDRRSSSVESVKHFEMDVGKKNTKTNSAVNMNQRSGSIESIRQYVDYVSEAVRRRRSSVMSSGKSSIRHRSSSVESVKNYHVDSHIQGKNFSRFNLPDYMGHRNETNDKAKNNQSAKKHSKGSTESLRRNLRANSVESILSYTQCRNQYDSHPELPAPKRKTSNFSMVSCNGIIEQSTQNNKDYHQRRNSCDVLNSNFEFYPNENSGILRSGRTSTNAQNSSKSRSRNSSLNYLNISSSNANSMAEFDTRDLQKKTSRTSHRSGTRDSFTNDTSARKSKRNNQKPLEDIEISNENNKENKNGDILTRVAIPRSTSFLKTDSSSRNSLNYTVISHSTQPETRKTSSSKLGLNEIFQELKNQEGLNNLDEILDVILNTDGMSFNNLKPIYKEFIVKLALILTKDEFYDKCKVIMNKQRKRKKKLKKKKVLNRFIHSEFNSLLSCGKKKVLRKTSSIYKNTLMKRRSFAKKRKHSQKILRSKDEKSMLLHCNDMNTSSGYFTYSECTYNTDSCTCISAEKCYCSHSSRGISMSPEMTMLPRGKPFNTMSSTFPNCSTFENRYNEDQHCYHCFRYKSCHPLEDNSLICECDTEYCDASDKCYCNVTNINMIDMLKLQGFAASDTSIDSFSSDYPTPHNWKSNLLKKPGKNKQYIQPSKSLEFVQCYGKSGNNTLDSAHDPSSSSFSYKDVGDSSESSALDYNLFNKAKEKNKEHNNMKNRMVSEPTIIYNSKRKELGQKQHRQENKFLVVSARDPKGRIIYMGSDKKHDVSGQNDPTSIKKSAEIAALFTRKQNQSAGFHEIGYHDLSSGVSRRNILETTLGYLP
ncbi:hypothetical protein WDU94_009899 [Cyamophila willieti]